MILRQNLRNLGLIYNHFTGPDLMFLIRRYVWWNQKQAF